MRKGHLHNTEWVVSLFVLRAHEIVRSFFLVCRKSPSSTVGLAASLIIILTLFLSNSLISTKVDT